MGYGAVDRRVWNDERFRSWDRDVRMVWLYLLSCPHGNRLGCFVLPSYYVADDVQLEPDEAQEALAALEEAGRIVWDRELRVVCIRNHLRPEYNPLQNKSVVKAALKDLAKLPDSQKCLRALLEAVEQWGKPHYEKLEQELRQRVRQGEGHREGQGVPQGGGHPPPHPDPDPDPEQDPDPEGRGADSSRPSVETSSGEAGDVQNSEDGKRPVASLSGEELLERGPQAVGARFGRVLRETLYQPDGQPPEDYDDGRDMDVLCELLRNGHGPEKLKLALVGLAHERDVGRLDVAGPGQKLTARVLKSEVAGQREPVAHFENVGRRVLAGELDGANGQSRPSGDGPTAIGDVLGRLDSDSGHAAAEDGP